MKCSKVLAVILFFSIWVFGLVPVHALTQPLNLLSLEKSYLEKHFAIENLECFAFKKDIGFTEDQITLIDHCLTGARALKEALESVPNADIKIFGISDRFMRTDGFHAALIPWDASVEAIADFLSDKWPREKQIDFLDRIRALKSEIARKIPFTQLYCSMEISNENCLKGYENLAAVRPSPELAKTKRREIKVTGSNMRVNEPDTLVLDFRNGPAKMRDRILMDKGAEWNRQKKTYEELQERFGEGFNKIRLSNLFCSPALTRDQCLEGAGNLFKTVDDETMQSKSWGRVTLDPKNTMILNDYDATIRFDLPPEEIISHFARKSTSGETTAHITLAEKLEGRTRNNPSRLRAVCDLEGLRAELCAKGFKTFIAMIKKNRDYRVRKPWTDIMFIDGGSLSRVNFALNSSSRKTYIYIDAASGPEEFEAYLNLFGGTEGEETDKHAFNRPNPPVSLR